MDDKPEAEKPEDVNADTEPAKPEPPPVAFEETGKGKAKAAGKGSAERAPPKPVQPKTESEGKGPAIEKPAIVTDPRAKEGDIIEVTSFPGKGLCGIIDKITGTGERMRYHCRLVDRGNVSKTAVKSVLLRPDLAEQWKSNPPPGLSSAGFNATLANREAEKARRHGKERSKYSRRPQVKEVDEEEREKAMALMQEKAREKKEEIQKRKDHFGQLAPCDIATVPWLAAQQMWYLDGGSGGIVLVDLTDRCVVLKPQGKTAVSELLAQSIANAIGVRVAQCRVVRHDEPEHTEILKMHVDFLNVPIHGADEHAISRFFRRYRSRTGDLEGRGAQNFGVLEYAPGHPLMGVQAQELLQDPSDEVLEAIGKLCALDVLINNLDRLPLPIWSNEGNFGNVMVSGGIIVGIDQQVNPILEGPGLDKYLKKVEEMVARMKNGEVDDGMRKHFNENLEMNTGVQLADEKLLVVQQGVRKGFEQIAAVSKDGSLEAAIKEGAKLCKDRFVADPAKWDKLYHTDEMHKMTTFVSNCSALIAGLM